MKVLKVCHDCYKASEEVTWSDFFNLHLCMGCYNSRCEEIEEDNARLEQDLG